MVAGIPVVQRSFASTPHSSEGIESTLFQKLTQALTSVLPPSFCTPHIIPVQSPFVRADSQHDAARSIRPCCLRLAAKTAVATLVDANSSQEINFAKHALPER